MKNWKKYLALLTALLLAVAFVACTPAQEPSEPSQEQTETPTAAPTETPTEEITEAPTEAPTEADYSAYMGNWYSGNVTLSVKEESKWVMQQNDETFMTGHFIVNENTSLTLYDVEGVEVANMLLHADGTIYAELYTEELYNRVEDFTFVRTESTDAGIDIIEDGDLDEDSGVEE